MPKNVLISSLAGRWYTADKTELTAELTGYLNAAGDPSIGSVCALILPHAGYRWSGQIAAMGIKQVAGKPYRRVIVIGPSHSVPMWNTLSIPDATDYVTPLGDVPLDTGALAALRKHAVFQTIPAVHAVEHSVQIEVPLLQAALKNFKLVPIVAGDLDEQTVKSVAAILLTITDDSTLVIASSDFTHYGPNFGYVPFQHDIPDKLNALDMGAYAAIEAKDAKKFRYYVTKTGATICGRRPIEILLSMLPDDATVHRLSYDTSGRMSGDYDNSVSYLSVAFSGTWPRPGEDAAKTERQSETKSELESNTMTKTHASGLTDDDHARLLLLARRTLRFALDNHRTPDESDIDVAISDTMRAPRGAFVTLKKNGSLRGCIGAIQAIGPLYRTVMEMAVNAAFNDPRFHPVTASEFSDIHIEISVLTPPVPVQSADDIVIGRHGVILEKNGRSAVFLPQVAPEQGWGVADTLTHLSLKAGLPTDAWKTGASFKVFEADVFDEPEK